MDCMSLTQTMIYTAFRYVGATLHETLHAVITGTSFYTPQQFKKKKKKRAADAAASRAHLVTDGGPITNR